MTLTARFTTITALLAQRDAWQRLTDEAIEPNPFYGPDYLAASERHLHPARPIQMLVVEREGALVGLFPLERPVLSDLLFGRAWRLYRNPYTCLGTPLIDRDEPAAILAAALECLARQGGSRQLIVPMLLLDGPVARLLHAHCDAARQSNHLAMVHTRAALRSNLPADAYRQAHWSKSRRSKIKRLRARCEAEGPVTIDFVPADDPRYPAMLDAFLAMEASGWKGKAGTALASRPATHAFAKAAFSASSSAGKGAGLAALMLNGEPIAMEFFLITGRTSYTVKVAYDEARQSLSPGQLLDAETLALVGTGAPFDLVDSCALAGHPAEALWAERITIGTAIVAVSAGQPFPDVRFTGWWLETLQRLRMLRHRQSFTTKA